MHTVLISASLNEGTAKFALDRLLTKTDLQIRSVNSFSGETYLGEADI